MESVYLVNHTYVASSHRRLTVTCFGTKVPNFGKDIPSPLPFGKACSLQQAGLILILALLFFLAPALIVSDCFGQDDEPLDLTGTTWRIRNVVYRALAPQGYFVFLEGRPGYPVRVSDPKQDLASLEDWYDRYGWDGSYTGNRVVLRSRSVNPLISESLVYDGTINEEGDLIYGTEIHYLGDLEGETLRTPYVLERVDGWRGLIPFPLPSGKVGIGIGSGLAALLLAGAGAGIMGARKRRKRRRLSGKDLSYKTLRRKLRECRKRERRIRDKVRALESSINQAEATLNSTTPWVHVYGVFMPYFQAMSIASSLLSLGGTIPKGLSSAKLMSGMTGAERTTFLSTMASPTKGSYLKNLRGRQDFAAACKAWKNWRANEKAVLKIRKILAQAKKRGLRNGKPRNADCANAIEAIENRLKKAEAAYSSNRKRFLSLGRQLNAVNNETIALSCSPSLANLALGGPKAKFAPEELSEKLREAWKLVEQKKRQLVKGKKALRARKAICDRKEVNLRERRRRRQKSESRLSARDRRDYRQLLNLIEKVQESKKKQKGSKK
jgi:hypothetical protein